MLFKSSTTKCLVNQLESSIINKQSLSMLLNHLQNNSPHPSERSKAGEDNIVKSTYYCCRYKNRPLLLNGVKRATTKLYSWQEMKNFIELANNKEEISWIIHSIACLLRK